MGLQRVRLNSHFHFFTFLLRVVVLQKNSRKITTAPGNKMRKKKSFSVLFAEKLISPLRKGPGFQETGGLPSSRTMRRGLRTLGRMKVETVSWISMKEVNRPFLGRPCWWLQCHGTWLLEGLCGSTTLGTPGRFPRLGLRSPSGH